MKKKLITALTGLLLILPGCTSSMLLCIINDSGHTMLLELKVFPPGILEENRKDYYHQPSTYKIASFEEYEDVFDKSSFFRDWVDADKDLFNFSDKNRTTYLKLKNKSALYLHGGQYVGNIPYESIRIVKERSENSNQKTEDEILITTNFILTFQKEVPGLFFKNFSVYYLLL